MGEAISEVAGRALRLLRTSRGLTLREVGEISDGRFTPTAVAGYERGERSISLERFCELAVMYGVQPSRLLAEIETASGMEPPTIILLDRSQEEPSSP